MGWTKNIRRITTNIQILKNRKVLNFIKKFFFKKKKDRPMTIKKYFHLSEKEKCEICQNLSPYKETEWEIFKEVEKLFIEEYGEHEAMGKAFCGFAGSLGPFNAISVTIKKGKKRLIVPENYYGFPVLKIYESSKKKK